MFGIRNSDRTMEIPARSVKVNDRIVLGRATYRVITVEGDEHRDYHLTTSLGRSDFEGHELVTIEL